MFHHYIYFLVESVDPDNVTSRSSFTYQYSLLPRASGTCVVVFLKSGIVKPQRQLITLFIQFGWKRSRLPTSGCRFLPVNPPLGLSESGMRSYTALLSSIPPHVLREHGHASPVIRSATLTRVEKIAAWLLGEAITLPSSHRTR